MHRGRLRARLHRVIFPVWRTRGQIAGSFSIGLESRFAFRQMRSEKKPADVPEPVPCSQRCSSRSSSSSAAVNRRALPCEGCVRARFLRAFLLSDAETPPVAPKYFGGDVLSLSLSLPLCATIPRLPSPPLASLPLPAHLHLVIAPQKPKKPALPWRQPRRRKAGLRIHNLSGFAWTLCKCDFAARVCRTF